jgi:hypothetical protein
MMLPFGATGEPPNLDGWEWEPAETLTHILDRGLARPPRAFANYLKPSDPGIAQAMLAFTDDDQVVFGLSLDDPAAKLDRAKTLLQSLAREFGGHMGYITWEEPPPLTVDMMHSAQRILYRWSRDADHSCAAS